MKSYSTSKPKEVEPASSSTLTYDVDVGEIHCYWRIQTKLDEGKSNLHLNKVCGDAQICSWTKFVQMHKFEIGEMEDERLYG